MGNINKNSSPAIFKFKNVSQQSLFFLKLPTKRNIKINFSDTEIKPNESGTLKVSYYPLKRGYFKEDIEIYISVSEKPIKLTISGYVEDLNDCPSFTKKNNLPTVIKRKILVVDSDTKEPIPSVDVVLYENYSNKIAGRTNLNGIITKKIKIGMYHFLLQHENYLPVVADFYISKEKDLITVEMQKKIQDTDTIIFNSMDTTIQILDSIYIVDNRNIDENLENDSIIISEKNDTLSFIDNKPIIISDSNDILSDEIYSANNLVFLLDVSLSMQKRDKMIYLKQAMYSLINVLREIDLITILTYNNKVDAKIIAQPGSNKDTLISIIDSIIPFGPTYGVQGLEKAYDISENNFIMSGNNQIILATDGKFNSKTYNSFELYVFIKNKTKHKNINLSIINFGKDEEIARNLKRYVKAGNGSYIEIDSNNKSTEILIREIQKQSKK